MYTRVYTVFHERVGHCQRMKTKSRACEWRICADYRCRSNPEKK